MGQWQHVARVTGETMIGETVGSYRVETLLGQGGMGVVYIATHPLLNKKAVVKFLHAELSSNEEIIQRFFNEARSATMIKHPGIVDVFDFGHHASGCAFILMEFLDGESLAARLRGGPLDTASTISIGRQIASACGAAHQRGIVHRDLKPDNIYLVPDVEAPGRDRVKVLDFGIAKLATDEAGLQTRTGSVMGTPMYMSPEQCKSAGQVDQRADIYSVGCILYEMVSGRPPFASGTSLAQIIAAHMFEAPPPLRSATTDLDALIMKCLAKEPADRFATMTALGDELAVCAGESRPTSAANATVAGAAPAPAPTKPRQPAVAVEPPKIGLSTTLSDSAAQVAPPSAPHTTSRRSTFAIAGVVGVLAISGIVYLATRGGGQPDQQTTGPSALVDAATIAIPDAISKITYTIESTPEAAGVYRFVDGLYVGKTPYARSVEPSAGTAIFVLKLEGYDDTRVEIATDRDHVEKIELHPVRTEKPVIGATRPAIVRPAVKPPTTNPPATRPPITDVPKPPDTTGPSTGTLRPKFGSAAPEPKK